MVSEQVSMPRAQNYPPESPNEPDNVHRPKPKFGTLRGEIKIIDRGWWKAMTDDEAETFLEKGYY